MAAMLYESVKDLQEEFRYVSGKFRWYTYTSETRRRSSWIPKEKKAKTSNMLILTDLQGVPIGWSRPISGKYHDSFNLKETASDIFSQMETKDLNLEGLFLNADTGFDVKEFRELCESKNMIHNIDFNKRRTKSIADSPYLLDNELYRERFSVEQLNAWFDGFKTLRVRYETRSSNWMALHCLAFAIIFIRKFKQLTFSFYSTSITIELTVAS